MLICNFSKTIHNIWLQHSRKSAWCLFIATSNDYVGVFRKNAPYRIYLNAGRCGESPGRDELRLWQASQSSDSSQMANAISKYSNGSSFTCRIPHLEGQEVFWSTKQRANIALGSEGDSHMFDHVNFSQWELTQCQVVSLAQMLMLVGECNGIEWMNHFFYFSRIEGLRTCVQGWDLENWEMPTIIEYSLFYNSKRFYETLRCQNHS
jgi:hypothetical protein